MVRDGRFLQKTRESEPNNTPEEANGISSGVPMRGQLGGRLGPDQSDNDWYKIELPAGPPQLLELQVDPIPNIDLRVELYDWRHNSCHRP